MINPSGIPEEPTTELVTKEKKAFKELIINIDNYKEKLDALVVDSEKSIKQAKSIQKQASNFKSLVISTTEIEEEEKKTAYDESRTETEELKKAYYEIRDTRLSLVKLCKYVFDGAKKKIEDFRAECVRKAEAERREKEEEEREKEAARQAQEDEAYQKALREDKEEKKAQQAEVQEPPQQNSKDKPGPQPPIETTATETPQPTQKTDEGQNGAVVDEITIEVYDVKKFLGAIMRGERGATENLIAINTGEVLKIAKEFNCKPGEEIISGVRVRG